MGAALDMCISNRHETIQESPKLCAVHRKENVEMLKELKLPKLFPIDEMVYVRKWRRQRRRRKRRSIIYKKTVPKSIDLYAFYAFYAFYHSSSLDSLSSPFSTFLSSSVMLFASTRCGWR